MSQVVYETDLGVWLNRNGGYKTLKFDPREFTVTVEVDDDGKALTKNPAAVARIQEKSWNAIKKQIVGYKLKFFEVDQEDDKKRERAKEKAITALNAKLTEELTEIAEAVLKEIGAEKKSARVYKVKAGFKLVLKVALLGASAALTGLAGWTGVGTVVGIVGMVRSAASIVQDIVKLSLEADTMHTNIQKKIGVLRASYTKASKAQNTAKEIGKTVINKIFAVECETVLGTVSGIESDVKLMMQKVINIKVRATEASKSIYQLMDEQADAAKELKSARATFKEARKDSAAAKLKEAEKQLGAATTRLDKTEAALDSALKKIIEMMETVRKIEAWNKKGAKELAEITGTYSKSAVTVAATATDFLIAIAGFLGSDFTKPSDTISSLHDTGKQLLQALAITNDGAQATKDCIMTVVDLVDS